MTPSSERPFSFADFERHLLKLSDDEVGYVLIGGLAVSAWGEEFLNAAEALELDLPIYSKDIDLRGGKAVSSLLSQEVVADGAEVRGLVTATRKQAPHMGRVFAVQLQWRGHRTSIEVLERLPGLDIGLDEPPQGTALATESGVSLLDPCSLFICKLHAANTRPESAAGNDEKHLRILARVIPRFLDKVRETALPEYDAMQDAARLLQHLEDCQTGRHPFRVPLPHPELTSLCATLHAHLR